MQQTNQNLDKALFFAIKREDFKTAESLLQRGANINTIHQEQSGAYVSSLNVFVAQFSRIAQSKGVGVTIYLEYDAFLDLVLKKPQSLAGLQCKCAKDHKCPMFICLQTMKIKSQQDIIQCKSDLPRKLIKSGASLRFDADQDKKADKALGKWALRWLDLPGLQAYFITKTMTMIGTKQAY